MFLVLKIISLYCCSGIV